MACSQRKIVILSYVFRSKARIIMDASTKNALSKVPEVTLLFWIIKIAATTLGETAGDAVSMSMNLGYLTSTGIFSVVFLAAVSALLVESACHGMLDATGPDGAARVRGR